MELSEQIKSSLIEFWSESQKVRVLRWWIGDERMQVYLRKSLKNYNHKLQQCLDIATIEVYPEYQFQGLCKQFLQYCLEHSPYPVRVENCYNPSLQIHLNNQSWIQVDFDYYAPDSLRN
ncbi:hypothetical protein [Laspinema olomoucense]|uniref:hypothetical protein n=1 Tax=Laspinema olomoucense TaxID=3231600 RepID=UPI0021BB3594|nr:hypothetical protein [Laspinema sp. D3c]MCT7992416.1 hypothetical protein [Laspinema sp. D3c]